MLSLFVPVALLFAGSAVLGWTWARWRNGPGRLPEVPVGAAVRLRTLDGFYRTRVVEADRSEWVLDAPVRRNVPVPFRVGESLAVEVAVPGGCILGRTTVRRRDPDPPRFVVGVPPDARRVERREVPRSDRYAGHPLRVDGAPAELLDLSLHGIRFRTAAPVSRGDGVRLALPEGLGEAVAWVLDVEPDVFGARSGCRVRARFSLPLDRFPG